MTVRQAEGADGALARRWLLPIGLALGLLYITLLGATPRGELLASTRVITAAIAGAFMVAYVRRAGTRRDRVDGALVVALVLFAVASAASAFPRQAFDAILAMAAYAAVVSVGRDLATVARPRAVVLATMMGLSLLTTILALGRQLPALVDWWLITGIAPPLGLSFSAAPWGHYYDFVVFALMLWPAWFVAPRTRPRLIIGVALGAVLAIAVTFQGSRAVWLAAGGASALVLLPAAGGWVRRNRSLRLLAAIGAAVVVAALIAFGGSIVDRLASPGTLGQRWMMWEAIVEAWVERPLTGYGPGSFPWLLQTTAYFDTNSVAPRHPDSAVFQLLGEGGLAGIVAVVFLAVGVGWPLMRSSSTPAKWAILVFLLAGLGANPTDFAFPTVVAAVWVALALPTASPATAARASRPRLLSVVMTAGAAVVAVAYGLTLVAGQVYEKALDDVARGDFVAARRDLDLAARLDPSMALYPRQRGTAALILGDVDAGTADVRRAVRLNPFDDLAWRTLAIAYRSGGNAEESMGAIESAIEIQRSDPTNLLLRARWLAESGERDPARLGLDEIALAWPSVLAAPGWPMLAAGGGVDGVIGPALERWRAGLPSPEPVIDQPLWLAAWSGRRDLFASAAPLSRLSPALVDATIAVATCDPEARAVLDAVPEADRRSPAYWRLRIQVAAAEGTVDDRALSALGLYRVQPPTVDRARAMLNPLAENDPREFRPDSWGYRRVTIAWPSPDMDLPDPESGEVRWLLDPQGARQAAGLACPEGD